MAKESYIFEVTTSFCPGKSMGKPGETDIFEGDIVLTDKTKKIVEGQNAFDAIASQAKKWPGAVVPYVFDYYFGKSNSNTLEDFFFQVTFEYYKEFIIGITYMKNFVGREFKDCVELNLKIFDLKCSAEVKSIRRQPTNHLP